MIIILYDIIKIEILILQQEILFLKSKFKVNIFKVYK